MVRIIGFLLAAAIGAQDCAAGSTVVEATEYGDDWPFAPDRLELGCTQEYAVYVSHRGTRYALNGIAEGNGYRDPEELRRIDPAAKRVADATLEAWTRQYGADSARLMMMLCPLAETSRMKLNGERVQSYPCPPKFALGDMTSVHRELQTRGLLACE